MTPTAKPQKQKTYTRRNLPILLAILAIPTILALTLITYFAGARSHVSFGGTSIWDSSLLAEESPKRSGATRLKVIDPASLENGTLADHLAQATPNLGGTSGIFHREATHITYLRYSDEVDIDINTHEGIPLTLSAESWQNILDRAADPRVESVSIYTRGAGDYDITSPWVEARYNLRGDDENLQALLEDMATWEPQAGLDAQSVSYTYSLDLGDQPVQVSALGPLEEAQTLPGTIGPLAQVFADHTQGLKTLSINRYRESEDYFVGVRFASYRGEADATRQAITERIDGLGLDRGYDLDLTDDTSTAYYIKGQWDVFGAEASG